MNYAVYECYKRGEPMERCRVKTLVEAINYIEEATGGVVDIINGQFYGRVPMCCGTRTSYKIIVKE